MQTAKKNGYQEILDFVREQDLNLPRREAACTGHTKALENMLNRKNSDQILIVIDNISLEK